MRIRIRNIFLAAITIFIAVILFACDQEKKWEEEEAAKIQKYLEDHPNLNYERKESGLYYLDVRIGAGEQPVTHDTVFIYIYGYYLTGSNFYTNFGTTDTIIFPLNEGYNMLGMNEAVSYMKTGGESKIVVPSYLGYGNTGTYMIPYTPLLFDVYLVKSIPGPGADGK
jgi:FKBP-type peptidyl-prolyl cis-trans isomerase